MEPKRQAKVGGVTFSFVFEPGGLVLITDVVGIDEGCTEIEFSIPESILEEMVWEHCRLDVRLETCMGPFPQVKAIAIGRDAALVCIRNRAFPNVKEVKVLGGNQNFLPGKYLVSVLGGHGGGRTTCLQNAFCNGEDIDLAGINIITDGALEGCQAKHLAHTQDLREIPCSPAVFYGTPVGVCEEGETVRVEDGTLLTAIDGDAKRITIPKGVRSIVCSIPEKLEEAKIQGMDTLCAFAGNMFGAHPAENIKSLVLHVDGDDDLNDLCRLIQAFAPKLSKIHLVGDNPMVSEKGGMLYAKSGTALYYCPPCKGGGIHIPEGVTAVMPKAMANACAESVSLPGSLRAIGTNAFVNAQIGSLHLGGIEHIGNAAFYCAYIGELVIPGNVKDIGESAFRTGKVRKLRFSEGLESIGRFAFLCSHPNSITLPGSLKSIGDGNFISAASISLPGGNQPEGLLESICLRDGSYKGPNWAALNMPGKKYVLPTHLRQNNRDLKKAISLWDSGVMGPELDSLLQNLWKGASPGAGKQDTALALLMESQEVDGDARAYVLDSAAEMAVRYAEEDDIKGLKGLLSVKGTQEKAAKAMLEAGCGTEYMAYALEACKDAGIKISLEL